MNAEVKTGTVMHMIAYFQLERIAYIIRNGIFLEMQNGDQGCGLFYMQRFGID